MDKIVNVHYYGLHNVVGPSYAPNSLAGYYTQVDHVLILDNIMTMVFVGHFRDT